MHHYINLHSWDIQSKSKRKRECINIEKILTIFDYAWFFVEIFWLSYFEIHLRVFFIYHLNFFMKSWNTNSFWLALNYDLLEDNCSDDVTMNSLDCMLPCVCSVISHLWHQNKARTSMTHSTPPSAPLVLSLTPFDIICDLFIWHLSRGIITIRKLISEFVEKKLRNCFLISKKETFSMFSIW